MGLAAPADAAYYLSKRTAQRYARHYARTHHELYDIGAACRPKGTTDSGDGEFHHRWMCVYYGYNEYDEDCRGLIQVIGGSRPGIYWTRSYVGLRCFG